MSGELELRPDAGGVADAAGAPAGAASPAGSLPPGVLDAQGRLAGEVRCVGCGYLLRGLAAAGACPECGKPVGRSMQVWLRFLRPPPDRQEVLGIVQGCCAAAMLGCGLLAIAAVAMGVLRAIYGWPVDGLSLALTVVVVVAFVIGALVLLFSIYVASPAISSVAGARTRYWWLGVLGLPVWFGFPICVCGGGSILFGADAALPDGFWGVLLWLFVVSPLIPLAVFVRAVRRLLMVASPAETRVIGRRAVVLQGVALGAFVLYPLTRPAWGDPPRWAELIALGLVTAALVDAVATVGAARSAIGGLLQQETLWPPPRTAAGVGAASDVPLD